VDLDANRTEAGIAEGGSCCGLVGETSGEAASELAWVSFPGAANLIARQLLRNTACCALLRAADGTLWMLRTVGHVWTEARLATAAQFLVASRARRRVDPLLEKRLSRALDLPQVTVAHPVLDRLEDAHWGVRKLAIGLWMERASGRGAQPDAGRLAAEVGAYEQTLAALLRAAIGRFVDGLEADVISVEPRSLADTRLYNFLVPAPWRRNRLQLAATFPLLVRAAAADGDTGLGADIRRVVDAGAPLLKALSRRWGVAPAVLRCLRQRKPDLVGERWESNVDALFTLLDALPAELRPGEDPDQWREFNRLVSLAEATFGPHPWDSAVALAWLRHSARRGGTESSLAQTAADLQPDVVALIDALRRALIETLAAEALTPADDAVSADALMLRARATADRYLSGRAPRRLAELATRYRRLLAQARAEVSAEMGAPAGSGFWPLLPEEYASRDGSRCAVALNSRQALNRHGRALGNCLGNSHLAYYTTAVQRGESFVVGLFDAESRQPLSTAELRVETVELGLWFAVRVVQHTAARNSRPSARCRTALAEVLAWLSTEAGQRHLRTGLRAVAQRRRNEQRGRGEAERLPMARALRRTVGGQRFESLLSAVREPWAA
jgi:hypothetical protein